MRFFSVIAVLTASLALTGCASLTAMQSNAHELWQALRGSMSGITIRQPQDYVQETVQGAKEVKEDVEGRIDAISEGVQKIQTGKDLIRHGLGTGTGGDFIRD